MTRIITYLNGKRKEPDFPAVLSYHNGRLTGFAAENVPDPTEKPGATTFLLDALDAAIRVRIAKTALAQGYRVRVRRENAAGTAWESARPWIDVGVVRTVTITQYSALQAIENDRRYEIKVIAYNVIGDGPESAYQEVTPMVPRFAPGVPTFNFAPLRYEYDSTEDEVFSTVSFVPKPNADGVGVTHWLFRYRENGTTDWTNQVIVAQPELDTAYGFKLNQSEIGKTYELQVAGRNDTGESVYTESQTILVAAPLLPAPTFSITYNPFALRDALYFTCDPVAPVNPVLPLTGYQIRYREVGTTAWITVGHALDVLNIGYFVELADRFIGKRLEVQMRGENEYSGGVWSTSQTLQIIGVPDRPQIFLTAQAGGFDVRAVNPPSGDMATGGAFRYREGTSGDWINGTSLQVRGLKGETLYQVEGWLTNPAGRSLSAFVTVTTLAVPAQAEGYLAVYGNSLAVYGDNLAVYGE